MGIRPESISDDPAFLEAHPDWTLDVQIDVVEPMGFENYLYFNVNGENIVARVDSTSKAKVLQKHKIAFDLNFVHFFDEETQEVI